MLTLNGVKYGNIFCAPGAQGFFGEGYPYHRYFRHLGLNWGDAAVGSPMHCGFVSKTITLNERAGNMPMRSDRLTPRELIPRSIVVKPFSGHVLNAVGLTGPGIDWALESGRWQSRTAPFMISFMPVAGSPDERLAETKQFVERLKAALARFSTPVALQFNRACPNTGHPPSEFYSETEAHLDRVSTGSTSSARPSRHSKPVDCPSVARVGCQDQPASLTLSNAYSKPALTASPSRS